MWLESLRVENFRGFEKLAVPFDERFTLLLGSNGAGKTATLEAIAVALGAFFARIDLGPVRHIDTDDARRVVYVINDIPDLQQQWPVKVAATLAGLRDLPQGQPHLLPQFAESVSWERVREDRDGRTGRANETEIRDLGERLQRAVQSGQPVDLPLVAYYGTNRVWLEKRVTEASRGIGSRMDGYRDCLDIASKWRHLAEWMHRKTYEELQRRSADPAYRHPQLAAVVAAVEECIDGVTRFWFDTSRDEIRIARGSSIESFDMLSDGYRNMIAMVADIAERAAVLNPHHGAGAAKLSSGIVLIDELELHLHPSWQRTVVASLRRVFPRLQFIATTHSPQVVASVQRNQVRLFADNALVPTEHYVSGRDTNEILEDVFGVTARPVEMQQRIDGLFRLLDAEDYDGARRELEAVQDLLGPDDASVVKARWQLDAEAPTPAPMTAP